MGSQVLSSPFRVNFLISYIIVTMPRNGHFGLGSMITLYMGENEQTQGLFCESNLPQYCDISQIKKMNIFCLLDANVGADSLISG